MWVVFLFWSELVWVFCNFVSMVIRFGIFSLGLSWLVFILNKWWFRFLEKCWFSSVLICLNVCVLELVFVRLFCLLIWLLEDLIREFCLFVDEDVLVCDWWCGFVWGGLICGFVFIFVNILLVFIKMVCRWFIKKCLKYLNIISWIFSGILNLLIVLLKVLIRVWVFSGILDLLS